jgi:hypothetical protein
MRQKAARIVLVVLPDFIARLQLEWKCIRVLMVHMQQEEQLLVQFARLVTPVLQLLKLLNNVVHLGTILLEGKRLARSAPLGNHVIYTVLQVLVSVVITLWQEMELVMRVKQDIIAQIQHLPLKLPV